MGQLSAPAAGRMKKAAEKKLRRLQLAAAEGDSVSFVFRPVTAAHDTSPAALRVRLEGSGGRRFIEILKNRGGRPATVTADFLDLE